jgi:hypothetical protein
MSGLEYTGFTIEDLLEEFEQSSAFTRRESKKIIRKAAKDIMLASQQMAPVDFGRLEEAHHINDLRVNEDQMHLEIEVSGFIDGRDVADYAAEIHQTLLPFGSGGGPNGGPHLGPLSQEKNASNPSDRPVGGRFLERAVDLYEEEVYAKLQEALPGGKP